jgi:TolA-binding protein
MNKLSAFVLTSLLSFSFFSTALHAQSQAAAQENEAAYGLLSNADYKGAAAAYQGIITGYPTDILVQSAIIQLGVCQFYLGEFDKALAILTRPYPDDLNGAIARLSSLCREKDSMLRTL